MTPEQHDEDPRLHQLDAPVDNGEQEQRADQRLGEGHLQDGGAQLDVLAACFHSDSPTLPGGGVGWMDVHIKEKLMTLCTLT